MPLRHCECCGNPYNAARIWQKYCSTHCRQMVYHHKFAERYPLGTSPPVHTGPTPAQEAEWARRRKISDTYRQDRQEDLSNVNPELIRQAQELLNKSPSSALQEWLDSQPELETHETEEKKNEDM